MSEVIDAEPIETSQTELARVMSEGDPELTRAILEKKAELAPRMRKAIEMLMISQTYAQDWTIQGDGDKAKACLSSAGAERIGRNFPISFRDIKWKRDEISDSSGKGYRYVYTGYAEMYGRIVYAEGSYSTRDEFLGKKGGEWRPLEDINEGDVRSAAHHIFMGNAVKILLGLRGVPADVYQHIMGRGGQDANKATAVRHGSGTQGGTTGGDAAHQKELAEICIYVADAGLTVARNDRGYWDAVPMNDGDERDHIERAKEICVALSGFKGKDGAEVKGLPASQLRGKRLEVTLGVARKIKEQVDKEADGNGK
jgi:hypothetical protein